MKKPRRYRAPQPPRQTGPASPPEVIELQPQSGVVGPQVTPLPGSPAPELVVLQRREPKQTDGVETIECSPSPPLQLVVVFRLAPGSAPAQAAIGATRLVSALHAADRKLGLTADPLRSGAVDDVVTLVLTPAPIGAEGAARLERMVGLVQEAVEGFAGATLVRAEIGRA